MMGQVTPAQLKDMLRDGKELALLDVREQGVYFHGHLLLASCLPLSHLELRIDALVPRRATRMVLCDAGDEALARRAAERLIGLGYTDVAVLTGGVRAWRAAGYEVFSGVNVLSKAFGEYIEQRYDTPRLSAEELAKRVAAGENLVILDSRPMEEYRNLSIPGGIDCPGAELVHRVFDAAPDPNTLVVVNCAGRTRSIIGAQSLINAGIPNRVMALKNGTMGWELAGLQVARGQTRHADDPSPVGAAKARAAAAQVAERFGVRPVDEAQLVRWQAQAAERTLYLLDVRTATEFAAGHRPGSRHAPGGQLVQATDEYAVTRHARIVLVDDTGVRATMTASWLLQMGWDEVYVLKDGLREPLERGPARPTALDFVAAPTLSAARLRAAPRASLLVIDVATSLQYRKQHIPGALWCVRSRLQALAPRLESAQEIVVCAPEETLAHYVARDLAAMTSHARISVLAGGSRAWFEAGYETQSGTQGFTTDPDDIWYKPYEQAGGVRQAMEDYLTLEVALVEQLERDGDAHFR